MLLDILYGKFPSSDHSEEEVEPLTEDNPGDQQAAMGPKGNDPGEQQGMLSDQQEMSKGSSL